MQPKIRVSSTDFKYPFTRNLFNQIIEIFRHLPTLSFLFGWLQCHKWWSEITDSIQRFTGIRILSCFCRFLWKKSQLFQELSLLGCWEVSKSGILELQAGKNLVKKFWSIFQLFHHCKMWFLWYCWIISKNRSQQKKMDRDSDISSGSESDNPFTSSDSDSDEGVFSMFRV